MTSVRRERADPMPGSGGPRARYRRILRFAAWHLAVTWWFELFLPRVGLRRLTERNRANRMRRFARRFHGLAVELGGLMIKVGQFMSSRLDVLPPEITVELEGLQDEVPPVPFPAIRTLAETELGAPWSAVFASVEQTPIAAASLGQAHRAQLLAGNAEDTGLEQRGASRCSGLASTKLSTSTWRPCGRWVAGSAASALFPAGQTCRP